MKVKTSTLLMIVALAFILTGSFGAFTVAKCAGFSKKLKFASCVPAVSFYGRYQQWWADEVEKRTDGRLSIDIFWMESLVKLRDMLPALKHGVCDIGIPVANNHPSELPLLMMIDNPYNVKDYWACMMAFLDAQDNEPGLKAELERQGIYFLAPYVSGYDFMHAVKPFNSLAEVKGKTFSSYGGAKIMMLKEVGINTVQIVISEVYEAIDRGTIFGNADASLQISDAFKHQEVAKFAYFTKYSAAIGVSVAINRKIFNSFPEDIQNTLRKLQKDAADKYAYDLLNLEDKVKKRWANESGVIFKDVSPEDDKILREVGARATEHFLQEEENKGHPARKTWEYYLTAQEKYIDEIESEGYPWERK